MKKLSLFTVITSIIAVFLVPTACTKPVDPAVEIRSKMESFVEYWNTARFEDIENVMRDDFILYDSPGFEPQEGLEKFKQTVLDDHKAYPDFTITLNDQIFDVDKWACIWTLTATNTGYSSSNRPPTGKRVEVTGICVAHFKEGKIKDAWISGNNLDWILQLGYTLNPPLPHGE
jgi:predicted ester cyclase